MSNPTGNYNRYAAGPSGLYLSTVNRHDERNGTDINAGSRKRNLGKGLYQDYEERNKRQQIEYMSSYSWEPSTPFKPSFEFTRRLLSSVNQFNSFRDSMEESKPSQNYGNDLVPVEAGTPVTSIIEMKNTIAAPKEKKISGSTHLQDLTKSTPNTQSDKQKTKSVDMAGREADATIGEIIARNPGHLEKVRIMFKEYVKDLIKPTWREGKLSKDAHKMIVKGTVDKIMGTVQQLPVSELADDSVKQNIANFVQYYMDKYGKL